MIFSLLVLLFTNSNFALASGDSSNCISVDHNPRYQVTVKKIADGVFKDFTSAEIEIQSDSENRKIFAIGRTTAIASGLVLPFFQVRDGAKLRVNAGEFLKVSGTESILSLISDKSVAMVCD